MQGLLALLRFNPEGAPVNQPGSSRATLGVLSLIAAAVLAVALATQISDQVINDAFVPEEYFSYFTIQTSIANLVALTASGIYQLQSALDTVLLAVIRQALFAYAIVTGVVYNLLLRGLPTDPGEFVSDITFPNEVLHVVMPVYIALEWLVTPHRPALPYWSILGGLAYPIGWVSGTMLRGQLTGWYPYDFLDPRGANGWVGVWVHIGVIAGVIAILLTIALAVNRLYAKILGR